MMNRRLLLLSSLTGTAGLAAGGEHEELLLQMRRQGQAFGQRGQQRVIELRIAFGQCRKHFHGA